MEKQHMLQDRQEVFTRGERAVRTFLMFGFLIVLAVETWLLIQIARAVP